MSIKLNRPSHKLKIISLMFCLILILTLTGYAEVFRMESMPGVVSYVGESTDDKPTNCFSGASFYEIDTYDTYTFDSDDWRLIRENVNIASDATEAKDVNLVTDDTGTKDVNIESTDVPFEASLFDVSIYPINSLLTTDGVQYDATVNCTTTTYIDLFDYSTEDFFANLDGTLAWVYVNVSFEVLGGTSLPIVTYKVEARNDGGAWVIMSAEETYTTTTDYVGKRLEGYLKITDGTIDEAPFDIRLQFKSDATGANEDVTARLKNDTVIRLIGTRE